MMIVTCGCLTFILFWAIITNGDDTLQDTHSTVAFPTHDCLLLYTCTCLSLASFAFTLFEDYGMRAIKSRLDQLVFGRLLVVLFFSFGIPVEKRGFVYFSCWSGRCHLNQLLSPYFHRSSFQKRSFK